LMDETKQPAYLANQTYWALCDINAAYVSFCLLFNPQLRNKPLGVLSSNQGLVIARNTELKQLGVKMADPAFSAASLAKEHGGHLWGSNFTLFGDMSNRFHTELEYLLINPERYSVDEAFGQLETRCMPDLNTYSKHIKQTIQQNLGLPVGIGVGRTRTLAKVANWASKELKWQHKMQGVTVLDSLLKEAWLLARMPIGDVWGIGRKTAAKLDSLGIHTALQLREADLKIIQQQYGVTVERTLLELRGIEAITLKDNRMAREQICVSRTMGKLVTEQVILQQALSSHVNHAAYKLRSQGSWCNKLVVFFNTNPFDTEKIQLRKSVDIHLPRPTQSTQVLTQYADFLLSREFKAGYHYQKIGVVLAQLTDQPTPQGDLFSTAQDDNKEQINAAFDSINQKFGHGTIRLASEGNTQEWRPKDDLAPPSYTTDWDALPQAT
jgi:DNA polymerase V